MLVGLAVALGGVVAAAAVWQMGGLGRELGPRGLLRQRLGGTPPTRVLTPTTGSPVTPKPRAPAPAGGPAPATGAPAPLGGVPAAGSAANPGAVPPLPAAPAPQPTPALPAPAVPRPATTTGPSVAPGPPAQPSGAPPAPSPAGGATVAPRPATPIVPAPAVPSPPSVAPSPGTPAPRKPAPIPPPGLVPGGPGVALVAPSPATPRVAEAAGASAVPPSSPRPAGTVGAIMTPSAAKSPTAGAAAVPPAARFALELGPFETVSDAERVEQQLIEAGYPIVRFSRHTGAAVYAVLVDRIPTSRDAEALIASLREQGLGEASVVATEPISVRVGHPVALRPAIELAERLRGAGHHVRVAAQAADAVAFVIRHGTFTSREQAEARGRELAQQHLPSQVVRVR